jgi:hypothetical protein
MKRKFKSFNEFRQELESNEQMQNEFKSNPEIAIQNYKLENPLNWDRGIYRIIVLSLGLTVIFLVLGVIVLMGLGMIQEDKNVPTILTAVGSAAIGALAGLLKYSPESDNN